MSGTLEKKTPKNAHNVKLEDGKGDEKMTWKGVCRECADEVIVLWHPFGYSICEKCGSDIVDPWEEK